MYQQVCYSHTRKLRFFHDLDPDPGSRPGNRAQN